jgi:NMD protein affecting ribosome stability and mRNA decay
MGGKFVKFDRDEDAVLNAGKNGLKTNISRLEKAGVLKYEVDEKRGEYIFKAIVVLGETEIARTAIVRLKNISCPECSRRAGGYFEAVLQLRGGFGKKNLESIVDDVEKHKDKFSFVSEIRKVPGGYDIYLGSKSSAEKIVKQYRDKAEIKRSNQLVGLDKQSGKKKYRFFYLIRL